LISKVVPDGGTEEYVYDQLNRQVLSRNSNMASDNMSRFVKYDRLNRTVYSGILTDATNTTRQSQQAALDGLDYDGADAYFETRDNASAYGYTNLTYPSSGVEVLNASFYDDYDFTHASATDFQFTPLLGNTEHVPPILGMSTGSMTKVLVDTTHWIRSIQYYDDRYRPIQSVSDDNRGVGFQRTTLKYDDFLGNVDEHLTMHSAEDLEIKNTYTYDHMDRLLTVEQCLTEEASQTGSTASCVQLLAHEYNELGQLIGKDLHITQDGANTEALQSIDYRYNIRGWLKSINTPSLDITAGVNVDDDNPDLFGMELIYQQPINGVPNQN